LLKETYAPVIRFRRAKRRGQLDKAAEFFPHLQASHGNKMKLLWENLARPVQMLYKSFICFILSAYMAVYVFISMDRVDVALTSPVACTVSSTLCSLLLPVRFLSPRWTWATISCLGLEFFATTYGFKAGVGGLAYLGLGVGFMSATIFGAKFADTIYHKVNFILAIINEVPEANILPQLAARNGGVGTPEMRIPALFFGSWFVPVGIL
jgi:uncharacterized membrane protein